MSTIAFDKDDDEIVVTVELFQSSLAGKNKSEGGQSGVLKASLIVQSRGATIPWAVRDLARKVSRRVYWSQAQTVIVGEELARDGLTEVLDMWNKEIELRRTVILLIAKGKAWNILTRSQRGLESTSSEEIIGLMHSTRFSGYTMLSSIHEILRFSEIGNGTAITSVIELLDTEQPSASHSSAEDKSAESPLPDKVKMLQLTALAILKKGQLGQIIPLSPVVRGLMIVNNQVTSTMVNIKCPCLDECQINGEHLAVVKTTLTKSQLKIKGDAENPCAEILVKIKMNLSGQQCNVDLTTQDKIKKTENRVADVIESEIRTSVEQMKAICCDPFGFANIYHIRFPKAWLEVKNEWDQVFSKMPVYITVKARLVQVGSVKTSPEQVMETR